MDKKVNIHKHIEHVCSTIGIHPMDLDYQDDGLGCVIWFDEPSPGNIIIPFHINGESEIYRFVLETHRMQPGTENETGVIKLFHKKQGNLHLLQSAEYSIQGTLKDSYSANLIIILNENLKKIIKNQHSVI